MRVLETGGWLFVVFLLGGCAATSASSQPQEPDSEPEPWEEAFGPDDSDPASGSVADSETDGGDESRATDQPNFTPGMSVTEATNAVPDTIERLNIEQEALAEPLMDPELYEPCALQGHHHFKLRVAVWDGRAVGLDVETKPEDEKLESCLRQQISNVEWRDKAKSINTVEYSY